VTSEYRILGEEDMSHGQGCVAITQTIIFSQRRVDYLNKSR